MFKTPTCKHPDCTLRARSKGLCSTHGTKRVRIYCIIEGCTNHGRDKEHLCFKHRLRPERLDEDSDSSPFIIKKPKRQICSTDNCEAVSRGKHGLCARHYHMKYNEPLVSTTRKRQLDGETTTVPPTAAKDYNNFVSTIDNQLEVIKEKQRQLNLTQYRLNLRKNALIEKKNGVIRKSTPTESTNPSVPSDTTNIDRINNNSLMNNSIANNNHNGLSLPPNSTTHIVIPPTFLLHTPQINNDDDIIRKANVNGYTEREYDDTACLECKKSYIHTTIIINKHISLKCNHHFCDSCITTWRTGWDDDETLKTRTHTDGSIIPTKKCIYPNCTEHHDRRSKLDIHGSEQSYVVDKWKMSTLLYDSIQNDDMRKIVLSSKRNHGTKRHKASCSCG